MNSNERYADTDLVQRISDFPTVIGLQRDNWMSAACWDVKRQTKNGKRGVRELFVPKRFKN